MGVPGIASITIKFIRLQLKHQEYDDRSWLAHVVTMKVPRVFYLYHIALVPESLDHGSL